jgi:subtilisin-like proprotein convertase family protein
MLGLNQPALAQFPLTVTAWVRTTSLENLRGIAGKNTFLNGWNLLVSGGVLRGYFFRSINDYVSDLNSPTSGGFVADGLWHYVAYTVDTNGGNLYLDGVLTENTPWVGTPGPCNPSEPFYVGLYAIGGFNFYNNFEGQIDEVTVWAKALSQTNIQALMTQPLATNDVGLMAYYRFNEGTGTNTTDATGHLFNGTLVRAARWMPFGGFNAGSALDLANGSVTVPHSAALNAYPLTLTAWLRTTTSQTTATLVSKMLDIQGQPNGYQLLLKNGNLSAAYVKNLSERVDFFNVGQTNGGPVNDGVWHHVAFTLDPSGGKLYVDGALKSGIPWQNTPGAASSTAPLAFGAAGATGFQGQLDELGVWNVALSQSAIQSNMLQRLTGAELGLVALYHLDDGTGTLVADSSGGGHDGSFQDSPLWTKSTAPLSGLARFSGRVIGSGIGMPNIPITALLDPVNSTGIVNIPDNGTVESTNLVISPGTIGQVQVTLDITHSFRGDLEITLIHPDGTEVRLKDPDANDDGENVQTTYPNLTAPVGNLSVLTGKLLAGRWRLRVRDAYLEDSGLLNHWSLALGPTPVQTGPNGAYSFTNLFAATYNVHPVRDGFTFSPPLQTTAVDRTNIDFTLVSGFISGRVYAGGPNLFLPGLTVNAGPYSAVTDTNGYYRIDPLPPGNYSVTPSAASGYGFTPTQQGATLGDSNVLFNAISFPVAGHIAELQSNAVAGVTLSVSGATNQAISDVNGDFLIPRVFASTRIITPSKGSVVFSPTNRSLVITGAMSGVNFTTIESPPTISAIADRTIVQGSSTGPIRFDVNDVETRAALLTVSAMSSDTNIVPAGGLEFGGLGTARTITITPASNGVGQVHISLAVTDEAGLTATNSFSLLVNQAPVAGLGRALSFNGVSNFVGVLSDVLPNKGSFSFECWLSAPSNAGPRAIVSKGSGTNVFSVALDAAGRVQVAGLWNTGVQFPFGAWHHLAVVRQTNDVILYFDGVARANRGSTLPLPTPFTPFFLGYDAAVTNNWLGGMDEVRVWNVARSAAEIAQNQNTRFTGAEAGLAALWHFDEGNGTNALDAAPHGLIALIFGATPVPAAVLFTHYFVTEHQPISDVLQGFDADDDPLTFTVVTPTTRGAVTLGNTNTGSFGYTANSAGGDQFTYFVSDGLAQSASSGLTITVLADTNPPSISFINNQTIMEDSVLGPLAFLISDTEAPATNLVLLGVSTNPTLVPNGNIVFGGGGTNRTVTVAPTTNQFGTTTISLLVSDGKMQATNSFLLTVTPVNDPPLLTTPTNIVMRRNTNTTAPFVLQDVDTPLAGIVLTATSGAASVSTTGGVNGDSGVTRMADGSNAVVNLTSSSSQSGPASITLTAFDGQLTTTKNFLVVVDDPPILSALTNQVTYRNIPTRPMNIAVADVDTSVTNITLTASSSNPGLVAPSGFAFSGTGANRNLVITPRPDTTGAGMITVTAYDGFFTTSASFLLTVEEGANYEFVELPILPGAGYGLALELNDVGKVVGRVGDRPVVWDTSGATPTITAISQANSGALAINDQNQIVGDFPGVFYQDGAASPTNFSAVGYDISEGGAIVGNTTINGNTMFYYDGKTLGFGTNIFTSYFSAYGFPALKLNDQGDVFGAWQTNINRMLVVHFNNANSRTTNDLGSFGGGALLAGGINNVGQVALVVSNLTTPIIYNYQSHTQVVSLQAEVAAIKPPGASTLTEVTDMNDSSELVGGSLFSSLAEGWVYTEGRVFSLQSFVSTNLFVPTYGSAINQTGDIAGYGNKPGVSGQRPFLMRRRWLVGQPVTPPALAINPVNNKSYQIPHVESLDGLTGADLAQATYWSDLEQRLYFLRPFMARVTWLRTSDLTLTNPPPPIVRRGRAVWPDNPQIHVAGAPVQTDPLDASSPYRTVGVKFPISGTSFDPTTKTFKETQTNYSVIHYVLAPDLAPGALVANPGNYSNYFQVVRSIAWNDSVLGTNVSVNVGATVSDPRGITNSPKSGFVVFTNAPYDGVGGDRAYDLATQTGPIIPVNVNHGPADALVVAFYQFNPKTGVLWADLPASFNLKWPTNAETLVIANSEGSGPLPSNLYPDKRIYNQPNPGLPGFNPNEEHAFFAPTSAGEGLFALRNDLNTSLTSSNYVLLKYHDPDTGAWRIKPYRVIFQDGLHPLLFHAEAGKKILPPYPLSLFPLCADVGQSSAVSGQVYQDHRQKFYAQLGPMPGGPDPRIVMNYFYEMQPDFFYDATGNGTNSVPPGTCIAWQGIQPGASVATTNDVTFIVHWPLDAPVLELGETLLTAKHGLPGIQNFASARIIFDSLNPNGDLPLASTARLYDPLTPRSLRLTNVTGVTATYQFPTEVQLQDGDGGKKIFPGLPYYLRSRLTYDPINRTLNFGGILDPSVLGEPLLLVNVLNSQERARIRQLSSEPKFQNIIGALYDLTRNPNRVDANHDGAPDQELLTGLTSSYVTRITNAPGVFVTNTFTTYPTNANMAVVATNIVNEKLSSGPKALTAGRPLPAAYPTFGSALSLNGANGYVALPVKTFGFPSNGTTNAPFTFECWFKTSNGGVILGQQDGVAYGSTGAGYVPAIYVGTDGKLRVEMFWSGTVNPITSTKTVSDGIFHHLAVVYDGTTETAYLDGLVAGSAPFTQTSFATTYSYQLGTGYTPGWPAGNNNWFNFNGLIDEVRLWDVARSTNALADARFAPLSGLEPDLAGYWRFDETSGNTARDSSVANNDGTFNLAASRAPSNIPIPAGVEAPRYLVIAENDDASLGALPVTLHVIKAQSGPFTGDLKIIFPDNVFDERLSLRHSSDFGGDPDPFQFEWYYHPDDADFTPTALPSVNTDGTIAALNGWRLYQPTTAGLNTVTLGDGGDSSLFTLEDNWFVLRYKGYNIGGQTNWSAWVGDPASGSQARAAFAPSWIKRVIEGINPFEQRTKDFRQSAANTYASMLIQAGQRYEGDVALNPDPNFLNNVGLIELYTTVLHRGKSLSIDGVPPIDSDPANNALLLAAGRIADLYMVVGNEAYADASDPTIGFDTSGQFGSAAPSIFAFQNQLDSLLEEELALLRGRDDTAAGVGARPVYNRLLWNFTGSDGEVAYAQTYNISDQNRDGAINEFDARIMFPQGHGDAWGHYLTALTTYYDLLRHPRFTWIPRAESTLIAGTAVQVDFLDERKFAKAAAAKARTGSQIVDLTYRLNYVEDPNGQFQGYKDTRTDRAWGVSDWARRAGQGAYFDWLTANAILPAHDPNTNHTGVQKIDRTTVPELDEIIAQHNDVQGQIDKSDGGLNPLGVASGSIPFDIDPSKVLQGQTHFDQVYSRAVSAVNNSLTLFNFANQLGQLLRRNQDTQDQLASNTRDKERDYKNRMIELFGYPYSGDIGGSGTYPLDYDGPDIYHYMYVKATELTGEPGVPTTSITGYFKGMQKVKDVSTNATGAQGTLVQNEYLKVFPDDVVDTNLVSLAENQTFQVTYPFSTGDYGLVAPDTWGARRAPGKLQINLSDLLRAEAKLKQSVVKYDLLLAQIDDMVQVLQAQFNLNATKITAKNAEFGVITTLSAVRVAAKGVQIAAKRGLEATKLIDKAVVESIPHVIGVASDALSLVRGGTLAAGADFQIGFGLVSDGAELTEYGLKEAGDLTKNSVALSLEVESQKPDVLQKVKSLEQLVRSEVQARYELFELKEALNQAAANYRATLGQAQRLADERLAFRRTVAATTQQARYNDMAFRIFQNDALQKYRAQFDLAARYVYLAAKAYDYETCLLGSQSGSGQKFLTDIVRQRTLGQIIAGLPVSGSVGLADPLARLGQNFEVYRGQLGFNNPETETGRFSLRQELFRSKLSATNLTSTTSGLTNNWKQLLQSSLVSDVWQVPEFRKFCRPFAPESAGAQPALVIPFSTTVTFGLNYFGWPLGGRDSAYDASRFSTKVRSAGVWFTGYDGAGLSATPRVYLVPAGDDILRSPSGDGQSIRTFTIVDQKLPVPFPVGNNDLNNSAWIPFNDSLSEDFGGVRRFSSFRAYADSGTFSQDQATVDSRLIGRSVWNTRWLLIIPGGTFLNDPNQGLKTFINSVSDIKIFFQTYAYSGN